MKDEPLTRKEKIGFWVFIIGMIVISTLLFFGGRVIGYWEAVHDEANQREWQKVNIEWSKTINLVCDGRGGSRNGVDITCKNK